MSDDKKPKPIDVDAIDLDVLKQKTTDIPGLLEYAHNIGGFSVVPTKEGQIKSTALKAMEQQTNKQMDQIYEQMKLLAKQVNEIKNRAEISHLIYEAKMSFKPIIGESYYLYEGKDGKHTLSLIAPEEWGEKIPFKKYLAKATLLADHTWDVEKVEEDPT
jgi:hypothetical protein